MFVGTDRGTFWISHDDGRNWTEHSKGLSNGYIRSIYPSRFAKGRIYVTVTGINYDDLGNYIYVSDNYGTGNRTVCVVYIDFNSTHYLNINQILVKQRLVAIKDVENDFNPNDWVHYIAKPIEPEESETPTKLTQREIPTEPDQSAETPLITTEVTIIIVVAIISIIGIGAFRYLRKR